MMRIDIQEALLAKVSELIVSGELYVAHGDGDLLAISLAMSIEELATREQVRVAVETEMFERADAGLVTNPWVHSDLADVAIAVLFSDAASR